MEKIIKFDVNASLVKIRDAQYPLLIIPFNGTPIPIVLRELNHANIMTCGDFSLIETLEDKIGMKSKNVKMRDIIAYAERNHAIVKESLVSPTYDQIFEMINEDDLQTTERNLKEAIKNKDKIRIKELKIIIDNIKKDSEIPQSRRDKEIKKEIEEVKKELIKVKPGPKRSAMEEELDALRIKCQMILPDDFVSWIVCYALKIDKTDIKKVSEKMLLDSAILAKNGHDNPADHIDGNFTHFNKDDINRRAWNEYNKFMEKNKKKVK